ncbi:MAG: glycosyltransferase family 4 protein, partial [Anaerolineales bacterium]
MLEPLLAMRITILNQFYVPGLAPTGHLAASVARHRASLGDQVTVVTSRGGYVPAEAPERTERQSNPCVLRIWTPRLGKENAFKRVIDYAIFLVGALLRLTALPPQDIIITLTTPPFISLAAVLHKALHRRTKIILWSMDCYPEILERTGVIKPGGFVDRFLLTTNRMIFSRIDHLVCLDTAMQHLLSDRYLQGHDSSMISVIPNWESLALFPSDLQPPPLGPPDLFEMEGQFVVLYLGNAGFGHRFESVMEAAKRLQGEQIEFLFIGGGEKWPWLEEAIRVESLANAHLHPYVAKELTPSVMAMADCALITMNEDALGVISPSKLHANLAMKLPILYVGPPGSNVDDAIQRYNVGASLREGDVEGIIDFLQRLRSDQRFHEEYAMNARAAFDAVYNDCVTLPRFDAVIQSLQR